MGLFDKPRGTKDHGLPFDWMNDKDKAVREKSGRRSEAERRAAFERAVVAGKEIDLRELDVLAVDSDNLFPGIDPSDMIEDE